MKKFFLEVLFYDKSCFKSKFCHFIEIIGNKYAVEEEVKEIDPLEGYSLLARQMHTLVLNEMFADVSFEVEGKKIPAHKNILVRRSEYFRAMLGERGAFRESHLSSIYISDMSYEIFVQVLHFIYTGHVDVSNLPYYTAVELMRAADLMNLGDLEKLCIMHLFEMMDQDNVVKIYKEAHVKNPVIQSVVNMCHDFMKDNFAYVSRSDDFCSLSQELMVKIIENIIPKLTRLTSSQLNENPPAPEVQPSPTIPERQNESDSSDED